MAKILVVDDDAILAQAVAEYLAAAGHEVVVCLDSTLAAELVLKEKAELAIIDYQMPLKSGVKLLADFRAHEQTRRLPVLFLSGTDAVRFAGQVPPEPLVRFLRKPIDFQVLITSVREMLDPESWSNAT